MIFKSKEKSLIVWDSENDKRLATFKNHQFETDDKKTAEKLIEAGYELDGEIPRRGRPPKDEDKI